MATPKYRSGLERLVANKFKEHGIKHAHEKLTLYYTKPAKRARYLVDFTLEKEPSLIIEVKGRFTSADRQKMMLVKEQHPDRTIIMLFGRAKNTLSKKSDTTYGDWCDKNGIKWIDLDEFEENPNCLLSMKTRSGKSKTQRPKS